MMILNCRATGRGAYTSAEIITPPVEIRKFDESRTGNHWKEEIVIGEGGIVFVHDISNAGKHNCYFIFEGSNIPLEKMEERLGGKLPCEFPARLHNL